MNDKCPIWGTPCEKIERVYRLPGAPWLVNSPRAGGKYIIADIVTDKMATTLDEPSKVKLSRWIYEQNQLGEPSKRRDPPEIDSNTLKEMSDWPMPSVAKRMDYCLQFLASKTEALGEAISMDSHLEEMQAAALLKNAREARYLIEEFRDEDWIKIKPSAKSDSGLVVIRLKGYLRLEELKKDQG